MIRISIWQVNLFIVVKMDDVAGLQEAAGTRFSQFELIGRGSFGDVYKAYTFLTS